jgi:hypothetical protein
LVAQTGPDRSERLRQDLRELPLRRRPEEVGGAGIAEEGFEAARQDPLRPWERVRGVLIGEPHAAAGLALGEPRVVVRTLKDVFARTQAEEIGPPDRRPEQHLRHGELGPMASVFVQPLELDARSCFIAVARMLGPSAHCECHAIDKEGVRHVPDLADVTNGSHHWHPADSPSQRYATAECRVTIVRNVHGVLPIVNN